MEPPAGDGLGYHRVDDDPDVLALIATMDATGSWDATRSLRRWERDRLRLTTGQRLLDVGCGPGDAALALAVDLGTDGAVIGVDVSAQMIEVASARARSAACHAHFEVGDALALDHADASFDVVRSERTLQWLDDPRTAVGEMARVVRPGGTVSFIDTDWSSFGVRAGDGRAADIVHRAMQIERNRPSHVGRRLAELASAAGLDVVDRTAATHRWTDWNPDEQPAPDGCFSMSSLATDLVDTGHLAEGDEEWFVSTIHGAALDGRLDMSLTMHAVVAVRPSSEQ